MHARVTIGTAQPGKFDDIIKVYRDSVLPAVKKQKGFKGIFVLGDRNKGKGVVISLWNTEADMTANESSGVHRELAAKVAALVTGTPNPAEHYEVIVRG